MTGLKIRQSWREKEKKCKRVMVIDATDYPLVRVMQPLPSPDPDTFRWALWTFREYERKEV